MIEVDPNLLFPGPVKQVRVDLSTRCNLRCVYCAVSHPDYVGTDMVEENVARVLRLVIGLARHNPLDPIDLNGHGETTIAPGWTEVCFGLVERGYRVRITSNFAKAFEERELEALACMYSIAISIDTADRKLLQEVRRRVDLRTIVTNMMMVRASAAKLHRAPPKFFFLAGLYDRNTLDWEAFARFAVSAQISHLGIWSLTAHPGLNAGVRPLDDLGDDELRPRIHSIVKGLDILRRFQIPVDVQGDFVARLAKRVGVYVK